MWSSTHFISYDASIGSILFSDQKCRFQHQSKIIKFARPILTEHWEQPNLSNAFWKTLLKWRPKLATFLQCSDHYKHFNSRTLIRIISPPSASNINISCRFVSLSKHLDQEIISRSWKKSRRIFSSLFELSYKYTSSFVHDWRLSIDTNDTRSFSVDESILCKRIFSHHEDRRVMKDSFFNERSSSHWNDLFTVE